MIALVGCSSVKLDRPAPARELYRSPLFCLALAYAERIAASVYVLSAKHGVVALDEVIAPYDLMIGALHADEIAAWSSRVTKELSLRHPPTEVTVLAGKRYTDAIRWPPGWSPSEPMRGMMIGERLRWLNRQVAS